MSVEAPKSNQLEYPPVGEGRFLFDIKGQARTIEQGTIKAQFNADSFLPLRAINFVNETKEAFTLAIDFDASHLPPEDHQGHERFRDVVLGVMTVVAAIPVELKAPIRILYSLPDDHFATVINAANWEMSECIHPVHLGTIAASMNVPISVLHAAVFLRRAMLRNEPLYRFIELSIAVEFMLDCGPVLEKRPKRCKACGHTIEQCPRCEATLSIGEPPIRQRVEFLFGDGELCEQYVQCRTWVSHMNGVGDLFKLTTSLIKINESVLLHVLNAIRSQLGIEAIKSRPSSLQFGKEAWLRVNGRRAPKA